VPLTAPQPSPAHDPMRVAAVLLLLSVLSACQPLPGPEAATPMQADSIVLDRSYCIIGFCPSYRLSISRTGAVRFHPRNFGDTTRVASDSVAPAALEGLVREARRIGFWALPDKIDDSPLCGREESDYPIATVAIHTGSGSKRVVDYLGCLGAPRPLRAFEARIDTVAGTRRWMPPRGG
jgi:hypothetical protein